MVSPPKMFDGTFMYFPLFVAPMLDYCDTKFRIVVTN